MRIRKDSINEDSDKKIPSIKINFENETSREFEKEEEFELNLLKLTHLPPITVQMMDSRN